MTDCGCAVQETGTRCTCGGDGPPVDPFQALRVAYGMLLGEDDFRVLLGNPRGKQMLHAAWLHGSGVVWGMPVTHDPATDVLKGTYFQAVVQQKFDVYFTRAKQ